MVICVVFFFKAEDGIRDRLVTGVQTCALPILSQLEKRIYVEFPPKGSFFPLVKVE